MNLKLFGSDSRTDVTNESLQEDVNSNSLVENGAGFRDGDRNIIQRLDNDTVKEALGFAGTVVKENRQSFDGLIGVVKESLGSSAATVQAANLNANNLAGNLAQPGSSNVKEFVQLGVVVTMAAASFFVFG